MAWTRTQLKVANNADVTDSVSTTFDSTPAVNSTIFALIYYESDPGVETVADNQTNTYTFVAEAKDTAWNGWGVILYKATAATSSGTFTVTCTAGTGEPHMRLLILEYASGTLTEDATPLTAQTASNPLEEVPDPGTFTPTVDNTLVLAAGIRDGTAGWTTSTMTEVDDGTRGDAQCACNELIQTTATAITTFWATGSSSAAWAALVANFEAAGGGGGLAIPIAQAYYQQLAKA